MQRSSQPSVGEALVNSSIINICDVSSDLSLTLTCINVHFSSKLLDMDTSDRVEQEEDYKSGVYDSDLY